jgi:hypothetical protein
MQRRPHLIQPQAFVRVDEYISTERNFKAHVHAEQKSDQKQERYRCARHTAQSGYETRAHTLVLQGVLRGLGAGKEKKRQC